MQKHVLLVEDDEDLGELVFQFIQAAKFKVDWVKSGDLVLPFLSKTTPDIILMDVQLPVVDGVTLTKKIRETSNIPIIMVTSQSSEVSRLLGLQTGVDDYVCKPFSAPELILRIKAILRRVSFSEPSQNRKTKLSVNTNELIVEYADKSEKLTSVEASLLSLLLSAPNRIYSRDQILTLAYNSDRETSDRAIDSHVKNVRKKLEKIGLGKESIESVYGVGYRYIECL